MLTKSRLKEKVEPTVKQLKGVSDVYRLGIVYLLAAGDLLTREIVAALGIPESLVSHHLNVLIRSGWVLRVRTGKKVTYKLNEKMLLTMQRLFADTSVGKRIFPKL